MQRKFDSPSFAELHEFCLALPKIELHAHLNGSLSTATLLELQRLRGEGEDPGAVAKYAAGGSDWRTLGECFQLAHTLTDTPAAVALATQRTVREFSLDGCIYLELRSAPRATAAMTRREYVDAVLQGIRQNTDDITVTYLISLDRAWPMEVMSEVTELAMDYHRKYPEVVVGLDLSGNPSLGRFKDFVPDLTKAKNSGLKLSLHFAEVQNPTEVLEMLELRPDRLGHAVYVSAQTGGSVELWQRLLESRIPVEVCLTSNVATGSVGSYEGHHYAHLREHEHPVCLCTDDAGVFATSLSREHAICGETFQLSRTQLAIQSLLSCEYAFCSDEHRRAIKDAILKFCKNKQIYVSDLNAVL